MEPIQIFRGHLVRIAEEWGCNKKRISEITGVSYSIISGIFSGTNDNPSLSTMQRIADALELPLSMMLKPLEAEEWQIFMLLSQRRRTLITPPEGYTTLKDVVLPAHKAAIVMEWQKLAQDEIKQVRKREHAAPQQDGDEAS